MSNCMCASRTHICDVRMKSWAWKRKRVWKVCLMLTLLVFIEFVISMGWSQLGHIGVDELQYESSSQRKDLERNSAVWVLGRPLNTWNNSPGSAYTEGFCWEELNVTFLSSCGKVHYIRQESSWKGKPNTRETWFSFALKNGVFWVVTLCGSCKNRCFGRAKLLRIVGIYSFILTMDALSLSETSVLTRATRHNIPKDAIRHSHRCENFKSYTVLLCPPQIPHDPTIGQLDLPRYLFGE
jgi:hypothetical protein